MELMKAFRRLNNESGLSMLEMLVGAALVGGLALGAASLTDTMGGGKKSAETLAARSQFASDLGVYLYSTKGCQEIKVNPTSTEESKEFVISNWSHHGETRFSSGRQLKYFTIEKLTSRIAPTDKLPSIRVTFADGTQKFYKKTLLTITATLKVKPQEFRHLYNIPVLVDSENKIDFCGDDRTLTEACSALDGVINPTTGKCDLKDTCEFGGSFVTLNCAPNFVGVGCDTSRLPSADQLVNPVTGIQGCGPQFRAVATGADTWSTQRNCGKKCTADINHTQAYYSCLKCEN
jgi:hypothetical protein